MIGRIAGVIEHRGADHVLIDVRGVGYIVHVSDRTLATLPPVGEAAALYTELLVREDLLQLFGFPTMIEKEWHRLLVTVQGVGAKAAMAMLSALGHDGVARAIVLGDARAIQSAPGVGPKIASRVVLELKAKAPLLMAMAGSASQPAEAPVIDPETPSLRRKPAPPPEPAASAEALSALINLGYTTGDAAAAIARSTADAPDATTPSLIRAALRLLAPRA